MEQPEVHYRMSPTRLLLCLLLLACSDTEAVEPAVSLAEGRWIGTITGDAQEGTLEWILSDLNGEISGEGTLSTATVSVPLTMEGAYAAPNLSLTIHPEGYQDITFSGTVSESTIKGRMTGAGLINRTVTLDRRP
jgi:hypothetical protein